MGGHKGGGSSKSTSTVEPWKPAQAQMQQILSEAKKEYEANGGISGAWVDRNYPDLLPEAKAALMNLSSSGKLVSIANTMEQQGAQGAATLDAVTKGLLAAGSGSQDITGKQITGLAAELYDNDMVNKETQLIRQQTQEQWAGALNKSDQAAIAGGNIGSSRSALGQAALGRGVAAEQDKALTSMIGTYHQNAMTQASDTLKANQSARLNALQTAGQIGTTQVGLLSTAGQLEQQIAQNKLQAASLQQQRVDESAQNDWFNAYGKQQAGWQNLQNYNNVVGSVSSAGQTATTQNKGGAGGASAAQGALGGAAMGASAGAAFGPWGAAIGGVVGGVAGLFSDLALKDKVKKVGENNQGHPIYEWEWNEKAGKEHGLKGKARGVLAQEIMKVLPDAVGQDAKTGELTVNYDMVGVTPKNAKAKK